MEEKKTKKAAQEEKPACFVTELDQYLFGQGNHYDIFRKLGAHPAKYKGRKGIRMPGKAVMYHLDRDVLRIR